MVTIRFICPRCRVVKNISLSTDEVEELAKAGLSHCKACGAVFRVNIDENPDNWSFELPRDNLTLVFRSNLLNQNLTYIEPAMPQSVFSHLTSVVEQLEKADKLSRPSTVSILHGILDPQGSFYRDQSEKRVSQWLTNDLLPQLEQIFDIYPAQAAQVLSARGLQQLSNSLTVACPRCGLAIPRSRAGNCPFCKDAGSQKTTEDPLVILKLRLAKGEISREEYEDLKKRIET